MEEAMDYSKIALWSDLDGTLFNSRDTVSEKNIRAIEDFVRAGGLFAVSTGRTQNNAATFLRGIPLNGPCIHFNGCAIYSSQRGLFLRQHFLPAGLAAPFLVRVLTGFPRINVQVCSPKDNIIVSPRDSADGGFLRGHKPCSFGSLDTEKGPWLKAVLFGEPEELQRIARLAREMLGGEIGLVFSKPDFLELLPRGISKGSALREAAELPEVRGRTIVAIGDYYNDLELLEAADIAAAPENAVPEVKAAAQFHVCSNDQSAVADLITRIFPQL
jgi:Cof subfamily protein (haloacid dehalogenase superfamily)